MKRKGEMRKSETEREVVRAGGRLGCGGFRQVQHAEAESKAKGSSSEVCHQWLIAPWRARMSTSSKGNSPERAWALKRRRRREGKRRESSLR